MNRHDNIFLYKIVPLAVEAGDMPFLIEGATIRKQINRI
jgi:hypothetical protein